MKSKSNYSSKNNAINSNKTKNWNGTHRIGETKRESEIVLYCVIIHYSTFAYPPETKNIRNT